MDAPQSTRLSLEDHLDNAQRREKLWKKIDGWPNYGSFLEGRESMISKLINDLDETNSLEQFYEVLRKTTSTLGNQLQEVYSRKASSKFFAQHIGKSAVFPCPDHALHYFVRITYENVMKIYGERLADTLGLKKPRHFPLALLAAYLHELSNLEQTSVAEISADSELLQYLAQWGRNEWPKSIRASDIIPRSWATCVAKMQQIFAIDWKPAPVVTVIGENGEVKEEHDDSKSLTSFVAFRSFFLSLFLYCSIHPQFFASNFAAIAAKTKEVVFGDLLVEWANLRTQQMKSAGITPVKDTEAEISALSGIDE